MLGWRGWSRREKIHNEGGVKREALAVDMSLDHLSSVMRERKINTDVGSVVDFDSERM